MFGPKREEAVGSWRTLHNGEIHNSDISPRIVRVTNSRSMRRVECVARRRMRRNAYKILS
jgi:hypothetical protein